MEETGKLTLVLIISLIAFVFVVGTTSNELNYSQPKVYYQAVNNYQEGFYYSSEDIGYIPEANTNKISLSEVL